MKMLRRLFIKTIIIIVSPLFLWLCGFIIYTGSVTSMMEPHDPQKTDAIIVLTGGSNRVTKGFDLLTQKKADQLFISGVHKTVKLKELLTLWGYEEKVPQCCITLGKTANTTIGNALETRSWIIEHNIRSIRLITATYHMPRAMVEFRQVLPSLTIIPHPVQPDDFSVRTKKFWQLMVIEYNKLLASAGRIFLFLLLDGENKQ